MKNISIKQGLFVAVGILSAGLFNSCKPPKVDSAIAGKKKKKKYGIASPLSESADKEALLENKKLVKCPQCGSFNTKLISQFGSTACKAFFQCEDCLEPFDYFKCLK